MLRRLWIGSQELGAVSFENTLDWKVKLTIVEKTLDWITRKWSCEFGENFGLDHKKVKLSIIEKTLEWTMNLSIFEKTFAWISRK